MCLSLYSPPTCMMMSSSDIVCTAVIFVANLRLHVHVHVHISNMGLYLWYMQLE